MGGLLQKEPSGDCEVPIGFFPIGSAGGHVVGGGNMYGRANRVLLDMSAGELAQRRHAQWEADDGRTVAVGEGLFEFGGLAHRDGDWPFEKERQIILCGLYCVGAVQIATRTDGEGIESGVFDHGGEVFVEDGLLVDFGHTGAATFLVGVDYANYAQVGGHAAPVFFAGYTGARSTACEFARAGGDSRQCFATSLGVFIAIGLSSRRSQYRAYFRVSRPGALMGLSRTDRRRFQRDFSLPNRIGCVGGFYAALEREHIFTSGAFRRRRAEVVGG